jgi:hypothetical protein
MLYLPYDINNTMSVLLKNTTGQISPTQNKGRAMA